MERGQSLIAFRRGGSSGGVLKYPAVKGYARTERGVYVIVEARGKFEEGVPRP